VSANDVIIAISSIPGLALLGFAVLCALVFAPLVLSVAGLTGAQILALLTRTMQFLVDLVKEFRAENGK